jgi:predicted dehydrogenase
MMPRRSLLLGAAAVSAVSAQTPAKIRTAVIGTGGRGSYLLSGVLAQPDAPVAALCDIKPDRLDKAASAAARDNPTTTTDWRRVIDNKNVDAVYIATPPNLHAEMAIAALQAGKHVYCEKPIGVTPEQVKAVVAAAKSAKSVFTAGQQLRSMTTYIEAITKVREGALGDLLMVKAQRHANADLNHQGTSGDWYFDVVKSGGYLIEQSVHNLDLCNWPRRHRPLQEPATRPLHL